MTERTDDYLLPNAFDKPQQTWAVAAGRRPGAVCRSALACCLLWLCCSLPVLAEHITDKLVVGLYASASLQGEPLRLLTSGTPLEVLEQGDDVLQVRLADDTRGWVEAGYVTSDKPASMMLLEAQAELRRLRRSLGEQGGTGDQASSPDAEQAGALQEALNKAQARIKRLEKGQAELLAARVAQQKLESLEARVAEAVALLRKDPQPQPQPGEPDLVEQYLPWIGTVLALVIGFAAGIGFIDYRIRKRYGGFRL